MNKIAVFLDRDGTLNVEAGYIRRVEDLALIPDVAQAIRKLNDAGLLAILVTNQTGPARGFYDEAHVRALNARVQQLLKEEAGAHLDALYYCPHLPPRADRPEQPPYIQPCACRKPAPGMIHQAVQEFPEISLKDSYMIGDKASDVELAHNAGCQGILLKTGYGEKVLAGAYQTLTVVPDRVCTDLAEAVEGILAAVNSGA